MAETDDISTLLVEFGRIIEKIDHITTDADDRALMKAHRFIAQAAAALAEQAAQIERLTRERDEAIREMSGWATKAGEAEGRLKASEWHGAIEGWKDRATTAERERDEARAVCAQVETWWLEQGMRAFDGAPACIFNLRTLLHPTRVALTKGGENGD